MSAWKGSFLFRLLTKVSYHELEPKRGQAGPKLPVQGAHFQLCRQQSLLLVVQLLSGHHLKDKYSFFLLENLNYKTRPAPPWSCPARTPTGSTSSSTRPPPPRLCSTSPSRDRWFFGFEILFEKILVLENLGRLCKLFTLVRSVHRIVFLHLRRKRSLEETIEIIFILDLNCIN